MAECLKCGGKGWRQGEHWQYTCVACNGTGKSQQPQQQPPPQPSADAAVGVPVPTPAEQTLCPGEDLRECGPAAPTDAATCLECGGKGEVDSGGQYPWGEWINVPCPTCQPQQDSNEWTPSGSVLPERFRSVTEQPQQQPPPQQEPLSLREIQQRLLTAGMVVRVHGEDDPAMHGWGSRDQWSALLHRQEQRIRADERARVIKLLDEMDAEVFETQRVSRDQAYLSASPYVGERNVIQRVHQRLEMGDE